MNFQVSSYKPERASRNVPMTTSLKVASEALPSHEVFGKNHNHVLRDIDALIERGVSNFGQTSYTHPQNGQSYRMFLMDRKGFVLLAMGFTKIKEDPVLSSVIKEILTTARDGKSYKYLMLPIEFLSGWLFT
ncbi:Phage regulatory protein Rha [anaerobic digester metagenome]